MDVAEGAGGSGSDRKRPVDFEARLLNRNNHFDAVRIGLALAVFLDHAWIITSGDPGGEPVKPLGFSLSYLAVNGFFILSGLLIMKALDRRGPTLEFVIARLMRIYPALIFFTLVAALIIGPLSAGYANFSAYWADDRSWWYPLQILIFGQTDGGPPMFVENNPIPGVYAVQLWTLRLEMFCYLLAPCAVLIGLWRNKYGVLISLAVLLMLNISFEQHTPDWASNPSIRSAIRLVLCFNIGAAIWFWRHRVELALPTLVMLFLLALASYEAKFANEVFVTFFLAYSLIWLGLLPSSRTSLKGQNPDISYGLYIWHFPIMQLVLAQNPGWGPWQLLFVASLITVPISIFSWFAVEAPALRQRPSQIANGIKGMLRTA